jgi:hypothetical protein
VPPLQVPGDEYVRRVPMLKQSAGGGVVQVTPLHGSTLQVPLLHPNMHVTSVGAYVQLPPLQVPVAAYVRRVVALAQTADGGELQVTPWQGSPRHMPFAQPLAQVVSCGA